MASRCYFLPVVIKIVMYLSFLLSIFFLIVLVTGSLRLVPASRDSVKFGGFVKFSEEEVPREPTVYDKMQPILNCYENTFVTERSQVGEYWIIKNYIKAGQGKLKCHESITMTTNGDFTYLQHIPTLVERYFLFIFWGNFLNLIDWFVKNMPSKFIHSVESNLVFLSLGNANNFRELVGPYRIVNQNFGI